MELPGAGYFYALATLSMAFVGFTSIVVILHQSTGKPLSPFHILITSLFVELGLMAAAFAMLAPTLAICGIREKLVWQASSVIMLAVLVPWLLIYPKRRRAAAPNERLPLCTSSETFVQFSTWRHTQSYYLGKSRGSEHRRNNGFPKLFRSALMIEEPASIDAMTKQQIIGRRRRWVRSKAKWQS